MNLNEWYEKGIGPDEYIESMNTHKKDLLYIYDNFKIPEENGEFLSRLSEKKLRVIVLTEDWCGDAMLNIPVLLHLAAKTNIETSFLFRDQNLELMDNYLTNGKSRSIPIFIFIDQNGDEMAKWGPRAPELQEFLDEAKQELPDKDADDFEEKQKDLFTFVTKSFRDNRDFWDKVYLSLKQTLSY